MMAVDPFALFFKIIAIAHRGAGRSWPSVPYLQGRTPYRGEFYALLVFAALAICLASSAINLISVYLAMEFLSITSYVLAGYLRGDTKSNEAGLKYFLYGAVTSAVMLYGMSLLYGATGTTNLAGIAQALAAGDPACSGWPWRPSSCCWPALASRSCWPPSTSGRPTPTRARPRR